MHGDCITYDQTSKQHNHADSDDERPRPEQTAEVNRLRRPGLSLPILLTGQPHVPAATLRVTSPRSKLATSVTPRHAIPMTTPSDAERRGKFDTSKPTSADM